MRYALLLNNAEPAPGDIPDEAMAEAQAAFDAYAKDLEAAGALCGSEILGASQLTTTVTLRDGELAIQDGPFVESKEMLAGVFVIDVDDLDSALAWAERCPAAQYGTIEVRPVAISFFDGEWHERPGTTSWDQ